jgi:hypothetical protein
MAGIDTFLVVIVVLQILQAFGTWAAKASIEQRIKSHFARDIEKLKALLQTRSAHEQELIASYVQKSWDLCEQTTVITHQTCQLSAKIGTDISRGRQEGMTEEQILYSVNLFFQKESPLIVESTMLLKKAYGLLPSDVIERLQEYESTVWQVLKGHDWTLLSKVLDQNDQLLTSLRNINADLLEGTIALPALLRGAPQSGFVPGYMRAAVAQLSESSNAN